MHRLIITRLFFIDLLLKPRGLILSIIKLRKAIANFTATYKKLKSIANKTIVIITAC